MTYKIKKSYRKVEHDYSLNGAYFITICTKNRKNYFGKIENYKMQLSKIGKIAMQYWLEIPKNFNHVRLDNWVIMPNHIHGIIILEDKNQMVFQDDNLSCRNAPWRVQHDRTNYKNTPQHAQQNTTKHENTPRRVPTGLSPLKKNSISSIINHFKGNVKRYCNKNNLEYFSWQPRFHDRIIRNQQEFYNIQQYIFYNPLNWNKDELYVKIEK